MNWLKAMCLLVCLGVFSPRPADASIKEALKGKNSLTLIWHEQPDYLWQGAYALEELSLGELLEEYIKWRPLDYIGFTGKIQTFSGRSRAGWPEPSKVNYQLQPEIYLPKWKRDWLGGLALRAKVYFNHWSLHLLDVTQGATPQINLLGVELRLGLNSAPLSYIFWQFQGNISDTKVNYKRAVVFGCHLATASDTGLPFVVYTEQLIEAGALTFYRGEAGIRTAGVSGLGIFITWSNGRQNFSGIQGAVPSSLWEGWHGGVRFRW